MSTLTLVNLERVARVVGIEAAEELDSQGLIRHDAWSAPKPTHYLVRVTVGKGPYNWNRGLRKEFEAVLNTAMNRQKSSYYIKNANHAQALYTMQGPAKNQVARALSCGLDAKLIPCILVPVNNYDR